jgi:tetratricopeptide (TPR) repeat protein
MSRPSAAIGRQELVESCRAAALAPFDEDNRGGVAILLGEAGVGKSAIIDEVVAGLWGGPLAIVRVEGRRSLHTPLEAFTETARDMLGLRRGEPSPRVDALGRQLQQRYGLVAEDVAHLLDRVAGRASGLALAPEVVEKEEAAALRTFFGRVLATVPGLLIIEDADALDPWSGALALDLLESTARHPVSVLVTARSEPWPEWTAPNAVRLRVGPLTEAQAGAMLRDRLVGAEPAPGILEAVNGHARGSPLVLELCARALLAGAEGDQLTAAVGESSRALVALALGGVSPAARAWLHGAALAGVRAPVAMLQAWKPAPPSSTPALLLRECAATGLARVEGDYLGFRNDGIREVIVGMVPERERRDTHRFIAEWLAAVHPARGASEVIAAQFEACGDLRRAAQHFEHAARTLLDRGVPDAAASLLKRAASVHLSARDHDSAMRVGLEHVRALLEAGDAPGAQEALARLERRGTVEAIGVRARVSALVANARGDTDAAVATLLLASGFDDPSVDLLARFEVETDAAELLRVAGRLPEAEEHAALAHRYATELLGEHQAAATAEDTARASQSASYLSRLLAHMGKFAEASQVLQGSLAEVTERGDDSAASRLLANLAFVASCEGKPADAAQHAERALVLSRGLGDRGAAARIAVNLAAYQVRLGNKADAIQTLLLARSLSRAVGWRRGVELAGDALARLKSSSG